MKKLWFYFNTMQLVDTFTEFHSVKAPANVQMISDAYKDIINVQMLPPTVMNKIKAQIGLKTNSTSVTRRELAAPSAKSISITRIALGSVAGTLLATLIVVALCHKRIWFKLSRNVQKQLRSFYHRIFWNAFIRALLQLFYPMILLALKRLYESDNPKKLWTEILKVVVLSAFLIFTFLFMVEKREEVDNEAFKEKYGAYLTNVETYLKPSAVHYPFVFLLRRLIMATTITFLRFNLVTQVLCGVHSSLMMFSFLVIVRPFDTDLKNHLEYVNEGIVLVMSYVGFLFSDYVESPVVRYRFGFFYISLIALGLVFNVLVMIFQTIKETLMTYRRWRQKKSVKIQQTQQKLPDTNQPIKNDFLSKPLEIQESESSVSLSESDISISQISESKSNHSQSVQLLLVLQQQSPSQEEVILDDLFALKKQDEQLMETRSIRPKSIVERYNRNYAQAQESSSENKHKEVITIDDYPDTVIQRVEFKIKTNDADEPPLQGLIFNNKHEMDYGFDDRIPSKTIIHRKQASQIQTKKGQRQEKPRQLPTQLTSINQQPKKLTKNELREAYLEKEIKALDDQIIKNLAQAKPVLATQIEREEYFKKVRLQLRIGRSATISELLSEIRELEEQNQQRSSQEYAQEKRNTYSYNKQDYL